MKWTYPKSSGWHSGWRTIFGVCPYGFGLRWDISGHWYRGFAQNFDTFYMGRVVWPGEPFLKKCPNIRKVLFFQNMHVHFSRNRFPKWVFPHATTGSYLGWSFSISRFTGYIRMVGPSVFPDTRVIPKWLDFQYFQIHGSLKWLTTQIHIYFILF